MIPYDFKHGGKDASEIDSHNQMVNLGFWSIIKKMFTFNCWNWVSAECRWLKKNWASS